MKRRANATLIGAFVVAGLALVAAGVIAAAGGKLFTRTEQAVMHFNGSIYGLQVGAPVVFRGVRLGSVASVSVVYDPAADTFSIPVVAELERGLIRSLDGKGAERNPMLTLPALVAKGLRAQLSMQSLLTGQLYIDLDLRPDKPPALDGHGDADTVEIPTNATAIQNLKNQLDGMDFRRLVEDVAVIASSARALVAGPQLKQSLDDLAQITGSVRRLSEQLAKRVDPLAQSAQSTLSETQRAMLRLGSAADGISDTARRLGSTADQVGALAAADSPLVQRVQQTADELARTATALRSQVSDDAPTLQNLNQTLRDVSRSARAMRELADLLERQPDALLRGRAPPVMPPAMPPGTSPGTSP